MKQDKLSKEIDKLAKAEANAALLVQAKNMHYGYKKLDKDISNLIEWLDEGKEVDTGEILSAMRNSIKEILLKANPKHEKNS